MWGQKVAQSSNLYVYVCMCAHVCACVYVSVYVCACVCVYRTAFQETSLWYPLCLQGWSPVFIHWLIHFLLLDMRSAQLTIGGVVEYFCGCLALFFLFLSSCMSPDCLIDIYNNFYSVDLLIFSSKKDLGTLRFWPSHLPISY